MHETSCHWIWCRWYACLLDLKAHARVHQTLLHAFNPHLSLGVMDTRLRANATSSRVSIYRDADQCAENVHSQIRKQQGSRLRCWHTTTEQQEVKNAPCLLPSTSFHFAYGYTCPGIRSEPRGNLIVCPCGFNNQDFFRPLKRWPYFPAKLVTKHIPTIQRWT